MPDTHGWPTSLEVGTKAALSAPDVFTAAMTAGIDSVLAAVIAEFQSPPGVHGSGGTGRNFVPITETRFFDGSGYPQIYVGDIVPGTAPVVTLWGGASSPAAALRQSADGSGSNILEIQGADNGYYGGWEQVFPLGSQNVSVAATWGYVAAIPADVYEAVLGEAASRVLVQSFVPLSGVGIVLKTADGSEMNTSAGISAWDKSSPIAVMHAVYLNAIKRYRIGNAPKLKALAMSRRMS